MEYFRKGGRKRHLNWLWGLKGRFTSGDSRSSFAFNPIVFSGGAKISLGIGLVFGVVIPGFGDDLNGWAGRDAGIRAAP
jgi:hypothetical protein